MASSFGTLWSIVKGINPGSNGRITQFHLRKIYISWFYGWMMSWNDMCHCDLINLDQVNFSNVFKGRRGSWIKPAFYFIQTILSAYCFYILIYFTWTIPSKLYIKLEYIMISHNFSNTIVSQLWLTDLSRRWIFLI